MSKLTLISALWLTTVSFADATTIRNYRDNVVDPQSIHTGKMPVSAIGCEDGTEEDGTWCERSPEEQAEFENLLRDLNNNDFSQWVHPIDLEKNADMEMCEARQHLCDEGNSVKGSELEASNALTPLLQEGDSDSLEFEDNGPQPKVNMAEETTRQGEGALCEKELLSSGQDVLDVSTMPLQEVKSLSLTYEAIEERNYRTEICPGLYATEVGKNSPCPLVHVDNGQDGSFVQGDMKIDPSLWVRPEDLGKAMEDGIFDTDTQEPVWYKPKPFVGQSFINTAFGGKTKDTWVQWIKDGESAKEVKNFVSNPHAKKQFSRSQSCPSMPNDSDQGRSQVSADCVDGGPKKAKQRRLSLSSNNFRDRKGSGKFDVFRKRSHSDPLPLKVDSCESQNNVTLISYKPVDSDNSMQSKGNAPASNVQEQDAQKNMFQKAEPSWLETGTGLVKGLMKWAQKDGKSLFRYLVG